MSEAPLRVAVSNRPPFVFVGTHHAANGSLYYGMLIDLLDKILVHNPGLAPAGYSIYATLGDSGGTLTPSHGWSGIVGELVSGRADIALFPLTRTALRLTAIDVTYSYMDQGLSLLVKNDAQQPGALSVLAPFTTTLWVLLLFTVFSIALVFWLLDCYGRWVFTRTVNRMQAEGLAMPGHNTARLAKHKAKPRNPVMLSFAAAAGAPEKPNRASWGVQVLYIAYCFFCLIVLSAYTANLTSFLSITNLKTEVGSLQDLLRHNLLLGVNPNGSTANYFAGSKDTLATQLQRNVRYCETGTCLAWVRSGQVAAFVSDRPLLSYQAHLQPCDMVVVGDDFGPGNLVIGLRKNSTLRLPFNAAIQAFAEDGTLTALRRAWFDGLSQCSDQPVLYNNQLGIPQMLGAFAFLAFGLVAAFATGTLENLRWCLLHCLPAPPPPQQQDGHMDEALRTSFSRLFRTSLRHLAGWERWPSGTRGDCQTLTAAEAATAATAATVNCGAADSGHASALAASIVAVPSQVLGPGLGPDVGAGMATRGLLLREPSVSHRGRNSACSSVTSSDKSEEPERSSAGRFPNRQEPPRVPWSPPSPPLPLRRRLGAGPSGGLSTASGGTVPGLPPAPDACEITAAEPGGDEEGVDLEAGYSRSWAGGGVGEGAAGGVGYDHVRQQMQLPVLHHNPLHAESVEDGAGHPSGCSGRAGGDSERYGTGGGGGGLVAAGTGTWSGALGAPGVNGRRRQPRAHEVAAATAGAAAAPAHRAGGSSAQCVTDTGSGSIGGQGLDGDTL